MFVGNHGSKPFEKALASCIAVVTVCPPSAPSLELLRVGYSVFGCSSRLGVTPTLTALWWAAERLSNGNTCHKIFVEAGENKGEGLWAVSPPVSTVILGQNAPVGSQSRKETTKATMVKAGPRDNEPLK